MPGHADQGRYFLAVWPDPAVRDGLAHWAREIETDGAARRVKAESLHITLVFLGALEPPQVEAVRRVAAVVRWGSGTLELDRIGYWKRSRIIWAGSRRGCDALAALAESLRGGLRRVGFRLDARPFVPHVTLIRKARRRPRWTERTVTWRIDEFCLVRSHLSSSGALYEVLDRWSANGDME